MKKYHDVRDVHFEKDSMLLTIDGRRKQFKLKTFSLKLSNASGKERGNYKISPSGYGIHWPFIDEDISIDGLLGITHSKKQKSRAA